MQKLLTVEEYSKLNVTYDPGVFLESASREEIEAFLRVDDAKRVIVRALAGSKHSRSNDGGKPLFLDVGCGMGAYLLAAERLGFEVVGFEPSETHAHVATNILKLPVIRDYFSPELVGDRRFDLIMLSHVIEHILSPKEFLHSLIGTLKPGGSLVVITPNSDSIIAKVTGSSWPMLKPPDHVSMLSSKTYTTFGLDGMVDVKHRSSEFPYEFAATMAAVIKGKFAASRNDEKRHMPFQDKSSPPALRQLNTLTDLLKFALTVASIPAWLLAAATGRRACLNSVIVRKTGSL